MRCALWTHPSGLRAWKAFTTVYCRACTQSYLSTTQKRWALWSRFFWRSILPSALRVNSFYSMSSYKKLEADFLTAWQVYRSRKRVLYKTSCSKLFTVRGTWANSVRSCLEASTRVESTIKTRQAISSFLPTFSRLREQQPQSIANANEDKILLR